MRTIITPAGTDYLCKIELIDSSLNNVVVCMLFSHKDFLPHKAVIPEPAIVRFTDVKVQHFAGKSYSLL